MMKFEEAKLIQSHRIYFTQRDKENKGAKITSDVFVVIFTHLCEIKNLLNAFCNAIQVIRKSFKNDRINLDLLLRFFPVALFNRFAYAGQSFHAIAGIKPRGINSMPIPGPARKAFIR